MTAAPGGMAKLMENDLSTNSRISCEIERRGDMNRIAAGPSGPGGVFGSVGLYYGDSRPARDAGERDLPVFGHVVECRLYHIETERGVVQSVSILRG